MILRSAIQNFKKIVFSTILFALFLALAATCFFARQTDGFILRADADIASAKTASAYESNEESGENHTVNSVKDSAGDSKATGTVENSALVEESYDDGYAFDRWIIAAVLAGVALGGVSVAIAITLRKRHSISAKR